ncbi:MAG: hypothetical protein RJB66_527 [Pseudomonadota bacterium]|jgi:hypothetical protein
MIGFSLMAFPAELLVDYFRTHPNICPYSAREALAVIEAKLGKKVALKVATNYLTSFKDFQNYAWFDVVWDFIPMLHLYDSTCTRAHLAAFTNIYCGYAKTDDLNHLIKQYYKKCKNRFVQCEKHRRNLFNQTATNLGT